MYFHQMKSMSANGVEDLIFQYHSNLCVIRQHLYLCKKTILTSTSSLSLCRKSLRKLVTDSKLIQPHTTTCLLGVRKQQKLIITKHKTQITTLLNINSENTMSVGTNLIFQIFFCLMGHRKIVIFHNSTIIFNDAVPRCCAFV